MANSKQIINEALSVLGAEKLTKTIARIQKRRLGPLARLGVKEAKKQNGLVQTVKEIYNKRVSIRDPFIYFGSNVISARISFLDNKWNWLEHHKNRIKTVKRKYFGNVIDSEQNVLTKVNIGKGLKTIEGYFIAKGKNSGKELVFKRRNQQDPNSKLFVPLSNPFRATVLGDKSLRAINEEWSAKTLELTTKEIERQIKREKEKKLKINLST